MDRPGLVIDPLCGVQYSIMSPRIPGFQGEYLWELDISRTQLLALAEAGPEALYSWSPAEAARRFSAVLVHIAAGNLALLHMAGIRSPGGVDLYGPLEGDGLSQFAATIRKNVSLEATLTAKQSVIDLLNQSFEAVRTCFTAAKAEELERAVGFFGEQTTVRRVYLRVLAHTHEHMGQAISYARCYGLRLPWPDPLKELDHVIEDFRTRQALAR
jgi:hypothetical protein